MTLSALIRKRDTGNLATAIPAIFATQPKGNAATVARIATVAVANPKEEKTAPSETLARHWKWIIHFTDREPLTSTFSPEATHAEVLAQFPDAVAAEPVAHPAASALPRSNLAPTSTDGPAAMPSSSRRSRCTWTSSRASSASTSGSRAASSPPRTSLGAVRTASATSCSRSRSSSPTGPPAASPGGGPPPIHGAGPPG